MILNASAQKELDDDPDFVEIDPSGRYGRYDEVLGKGAFKTVYRAFDEFEGMEVAWNQVKMFDVISNLEDTEHINSEVHLLKTLKHKNIIKYYNSWFDTEKNNINIITEVFTSGTLRQYRKKHKRVETRALKNWSRQILEGLLYLHGHDPPVIHRDLKCDNIFVNGNQGEVKIGDLGLAAILCKAGSAHSILGTIEFMAPELYEEDYNELVDIYAFGMCLLEMVTLEYPYVECANAVQIYKKVAAGIKPLSLEKVKDPEMKKFIEKCIANVSGRCSARDLLMDPFLKIDDENKVMAHYGRSISGKIEANTISSGSGTSPFMENRDFTVGSQRKDVNTIFLKLCIPDPTGHVRNIHFPFDIAADTALSVATEMVTELDLTDQDVPTIAAMIESEVEAHIALKTSGQTIEDDLGDAPAVSDISMVNNNNEFPVLANELFDNENFSGFKLERLPSGRVYFSDSPKRASVGSPGKPIMPTIYSYTNAVSGAAGFLEGYTDAKVHLDDVVLPPTEKKEEIVASGGSKIEGDRSGGDSERLLVCEGENLKLVAQKLEQLLEEQRRELDELKSKHKEAIVNILQELPAQLRPGMLNMCLSKVFDDRIAHD